MVIDREYIVERMSQIIAERQAKSVRANIQSEKEFRIKHFFPKWMRPIVFNPYNPAFAIYQQTKQNKGKAETLPLASLNPLVVDHLKYYLNVDLHFDTDLYYPKKDEDVVRQFIDYKLKSFLSGGSTIAMTEKQKRRIGEREDLDKKISKKGDFYCLNLDGQSYYLTKKGFGANVFIEEYGLKELPPEMKEYMKGKDFLDVGACLGDSAIFFLKYEPRMVYAYEPVSDSIKEISKTIEKNAPDKITLVKKGIGDTETSFDIFVNPDCLSVCSLNATIVDTNLPTETIQVTTIDKECVDKKVGLIKMDIEGFEYNAIQGALNTIKRDEPILLISLYHTAKDFFEIPKILKDLVPSYQFRFLDIELLNPLCEKILLAYPTNTSPK